MTKAEIAKARALCDAVSRGPWIVFYWDGDYNLHGGVEQDCGGDPEDGWGRVYGYAQRDGINLGTIDGAEERAEFIAAARTLLPAALDEIDRLTRGLEALRSNGGRHAEWAAGNMLAGREWNDDGTAQKGGT